METRLTSQPTNTAASATEAENSYIQFRAARSRFQNHHLRPWPDNFGRSRHDHHAHNNDSAIPDSNSAAVSGGLLAPTGPSEPTSPEVLTRHRMPSVRVSQIATASFGAGVRARGRARCDGSAKIGAGSGVFTTGALCGQAPAFSLQIAR